MKLVEEPPLVGDFVEHVNGDSEIDSPVPARDAEVLRGARRRVDAVQQAGATCAPLETSNHPWL
jgi:hypothetical protein